MGAFTIVNFLLFIYTCRAFLITDILSSSDINKAVADVKAENSFEYKLFMQEVGLRSKSADQVRKVFEMLDRDRSGFIEEAELILFLQDFKADARRLTPAETANLKNAGDPNNTGKIGPDGFLAMVKHQKIKAKETTRV